MATRARTHHGKKHIHHFSICAISRRGRRLKRVFGQVQTRGVRALAPVFNGLWIAARFVQTAAPIAKRRHRHGNPRIHQRVCKLHGHIAHHKSGRFNRAVGQGRQLPLEQTLCIDIFHKHGRLIGQQSGTGGCNRVDINDILGLRPLQRIHNRVQRLSFKPHPAVEPAKPVANAGIFCPILHLFARRIAQGL